MDKQVLFLQVWANEVQPIVDEYMRCVERLGPKLGYRQWQLHAIDVVEQKIDWNEIDTPEQFQADLIAAGFMYVDLMIRFGVFDNDSKS